MRFATLPMEGGSRRASSQLSNDEAHLWHAVYSFTANMVIKQNAHPQAVQVVLDSFYVDDGLTGANAIEEVKRLRKGLQDLVSLGGFVLHKWKTSEPAIAEHIPSHLLDKITSQEITCTYTFTKVLGVEWDTNSDMFCSMISSPSPGGTLTKQTLLSHITSLYDILGWCFPALIKPKIL